MKKSLLAFIVSLFLVALTACTFEIIESDKSSGGTDNETSESDTGEKSAKEDQSGSGESVMDIYQKAIAAAEEVESAEVSAEVEQILGFDGEEMKTSSQFTMLMTMDPFAMHQVGTTTMAFGPDDEETMDIEMYMTDEDMYLYEGFTGQWLSMGGDMGELLGDMTDVDDQQDPYEQLKMFEDHIEHFTVEVTNDSYILSLTVDAESFDEVFKEMLEDTMSGELDMLFEDDSFDPFENTDIEALAYQITLDKDSLQIKAYDMQMDMTITEEGESLRISQDMRSVYSKINEVGPIEIPQEVIDEAVSAF